MQEGEEGGEKKGFLGLGGHKKVTIELLRLMILHTLIRQRLWSCRLELLPLNV